MREQSLAQRIREDIEALPDTMQRIIDANGAYIEDRIRRRNGVRKDAESETNQRRNTVDEAVMAKFYATVDEMTTGKGVPFAIEEPTTVPLVELEEVPILDDEEGGVDMVDRAGFDRDETQIINEMQDE